MAREKDRLPLNVFWIDQEGEWDATVDIVREWMYHPDVKPYWLQVPFRIFNATSTQDHWLHAWDPGREADWVHPKDPISLKENVYGTDRFHELFAGFQNYYWPRTPMCCLSGVRTEESPVRFRGLTGYVTYKGETWGKLEDRRRQHYMFSPLYDWSYFDVWKAIHEHGWSYNRIYDIQYRYGIPVRAMRISNVHHETAVRSLFYMQEAEPDTYERLVRRIAGIDMVGKMGAADYFVSTLPSMFSSWREYRDYLLEHLIEKPEWRAAMARRFVSHDCRFAELGDQILCKAHIQSILTNDWEGEKLRHFEALYSGEVGRDRMHQKVAQAERRKARV